MNEFVGMEFEFNKMDIELNNSGMKSGSGVVYVYDCREENNRIEELRSLVKEYIHDNKNPELPKEPSGSLFGIGFIYDEDRDDRVLIAIDKIKYMKGIVAVGESKGVINIYGNLSYKLESIELCGDTWSVNEVLFKDGEWVVGS